MLLLYFVSRGKQKGKKVYTDLCCSGDVSSSRHKAKKRPLPLTCHGMLCCLAASEGGECGPFHLLCLSLLISFLHPPPQCKSPFCWAPRACSACSAHSASEDSQLLSFSCVCAFAFVLPSCVNFCHPAYVVKLNDETI